MKRSTLIYFLIFFFFALITALFIGSRDLYVGKDTLNYYKFYQSLSLNQVYPGFSDPLFILLGKALLYLNLDFRYFLTLVSFISTLGLCISYYLMIDKLSLNRNYVLPLIVIALNILLLSPFYWGTQINIIRTGLSIPAIYLAMILLSENKIKKGALLLILATLIHITNVQFLILFICFYVFNKIMPINARKTYLTIYTLIILGYLLGINQSIAFILPMDLFGVSDYSNYFEYEDLNSAIYRAGIRYDFAIFTLFFILLLYISSKKVNNNFFNSFFCYCALLTLPFFLIGHIPFSDRLLSTFWMLIPLILAVAIYSYVKPRYLILYTFPILTLTFFISYFIAIDSYLFF